MHLRRHLYFIVILLLMPLLATAASCPTGVELGERVTGPDYTENNEAVIFYNHDGIFGAELLSDEPFIPLEVSGLRLISVVTGEHVMPQIKQFMGTDFEIVNCIVSCYSGSGKEAVFWIIELLDESEAGLLIDQMTGRILSSSFFVQYAALESDRVDTLHYTRPGGKAGTREHHFFYRKEQFVYWVSMNACDPESLMSDFIGQF